MLFWDPGTEGKSHLEPILGKRIFMGNRETAASVGGEDSGMADFQFGVRRVAHALASSCRFVGFGRDEREC